VSLYFLQISNGDLLKLVIYRIALCTVIPIIFYFTGNIGKSNKRIWLLRSGMIATMIYFITILILGHKMSEYYILMGLIFGLREGLYWSCFNIFEYEGVEKSERRSFLGLYTILKNILGILFPIIFGGIIYSNSFWTGTLVMTIFTILGFIASMMYKDKKHENEGKFDIKTLLNIQFKDTNLLYVCIYHIFTGMIYSTAGFKLLADVYILSIFNDSISAGWITAVQSLVSCILGVLIIKVLKTSRRMKLINNMCSILMIIVLILLIFTPTNSTVILFYFAFGMYKDIESNIDGIICNNVVNISDILRTHKSEYSFLSDSWLYIGRILGYLVLILYALRANTIFIALFIIPILGIMIIFNILLGDKRDIFE